RAREELARALASGIHQDDHRPLIRVRIAGHRALQLDDLDRAEEERDGLSAARHRLAQLGVFREEAAQDEVYRVRRSTRIAAKVDDDAGRFLQLRDRGEHVRGYAHGPLREADVAIAARQDAMRFAGARGDALAREVGVEARAVG